LPKDEQELFSEGERPQSNLEATHSRLKEKEDVVVASLITVYSEEKEDRTDEP
jgi:hypothetical protein